MKKIIRLDIEYPARTLRLDDGNNIDPAQVSFNIIAVAVNTAYGGQGKQMDLKTSRMWAKIQDRLLDDDGKAVSGDVELSEEQFDFMYETVTKASYPPGFAPVLEKFADHIEAVKLKKADEAQEKADKP